ncbi:hypothetical protein SCHPADRAFT_939629 [Schizopora paradoxa]|uniref:Uncharacterized protein n=1 Tax=Schizopora paradoxa TaxID=27342 RepID=A0A0H2RR19_9AGAM|nr:hypothetical protein SCHPADRAFT_939629 [Schizopora paradoxa]
MLILRFKWATTELDGLTLSFGGVFRTCVPSLAAVTGPAQAIAYIVAWALSIVFDCVIFALTVYRTLKLRAVHSFNGSYGSLANLLLRDGSLYFAIMAISYIIHLVLFFTIENSFYANSLGNNAFLTHTISVTMMSRLILNLNSYSDRRAQASEVVRQLEIPL